MKYKGVLHKYKPAVRSHKQFGFYIYNINNHSNQSIYKAFMNGADNLMFQAKQRVTHAHN